MNYEVCIVGTGVAGALAAYKIASSGKTVVMLEAGPRIDFLGKERYERTKRGEDPWNWETPERDLYEESAFPRLKLNNNRVKGIGGTTLKWNARAERLKPNDFKMQSLFGIAADWPITYDDIQPWYLKAEQELGVAGKDTPGAPPRTAPFPLPHHPLSFGEKEFIIPAFNELGLPIGYDSLAINSEDYDNRPKCEVYSTCIPMCPIHAKYTAMTHVFKAESTGKVMIKPNCQVRRIKLNAKRNVKSIQYVDADGATKKQEARIFILAAGGVETPRLLLLSSKDSSYENGLANSSNQVGRNYMTHPWIEVRGLLSDKIGPHRTGFSTTCSWALYNHEGLPEMGNALIKPNVHEGPEPVNIAAKSKLWGKELKEKVQQEYGHEAGFDIFSEMLPKQENKIQLSNSLVDCYGDPVPRIEMHLGDFDRKTLLNGAETSRKLFKQMEATEIWDRGIKAIPNHIIGTTRMGNNPQNSVCNKWGRCHDLDNLYVAGSSLFPTSGCAAPTLTISALALRTADYISRNL